MSKKKLPLRFSDWQRQVLDELKAIAAEKFSSLRIIGKPTQLADGAMAIIMRLHTTEIPVAPNGLKLQSCEDFAVKIPYSCYVPPEVEVSHQRFVGFPHILQGQRLCIYLDPSREWDFAGGAASFLNRLWDWLKDAAAGRFDASTAMYHAVGGVLHRQSGTPTIVVRAPISDSWLHTAQLIVRTENRYDIAYSDDATCMRLPVLTLSGALPFGASSTLRQLLERMDIGSQTYGQVSLSSGQTHGPAFTTALVASAVRNGAGTDQYFLLAVPNPVGGPPHLLAGRLPAYIADELRLWAAGQSGAIALEHNSINPNIPIEWCNVSDERTEVTTRRDSSRPVRTFQGKHIQIWGCGGLGSWMAEFIARAGASRIVLCDPGIITGGLLVRQNYVENDVGDSKAVALARRLKSINDDLVVEVVEGILPEDLAHVLSADLVVDATVSVRIARIFDSLAPISERKAVFAQVSTDSRTGTLGLLHLCAPHDLTIPTEIDQQAGMQVLKNGELELYHCLWQEPQKGNEIIPTRGCSVPTFHGSSADLAAIAASLVSLLGMHLESPSLSGTHLVALPHADAGARHHFIAPEAAA